MQIYFGLFHTAELSLNVTVNRRGGMRRGQAGINRPRLEVKLNTKMLGFTLFLFIGCLMFKREGGGGLVPTLRANHRATSRPNMTSNEETWRYSWHHFD